MYGREELKVYYADFELQLYKSNPFPGHDDTDTFIRKPEANKVMDAYEARIKELEEANKRTQKHREEVESSESNIRQEMFKMKARIKELEAENERLKAMKWISVDDIKPQWGKKVKVKFKDGSEDEVRFSHDYKWVSKGMATCESSEVTHWTPLPPTKESETKENG